MVTACETLFFFLDIHSCSRCPRVFGAIIFFSVNASPQLNVSRVMCHHGYYNLFCRVCEYNTIVVMKCMFVA